MTQGKLDVKIILNVAHADNPPPSPARIETSMWATRLIMHRCRRLVGVVEGKDRDAEGAWSHPRERQGEKTPPRLRCHDLCRQYLQQAYSPPLLPPVRSTTTRTFTFTHPSQTLLWQHFPRRPLRTALTKMHSPPPGQCAFLSPFVGLPTEARTQGGPSTHVSERTMQHTSTAKIRRHAHQHIFGKSRSRHQIGLKRRSQTRVSIPVARVALPRRGRRRRFLKRES